MSSLNSKSKSSDVRHPTLRRHAETIIQNWDEFGRKSGAPQLFFDMRREAEGFLAWLRARKEYSDNSLHRYLVEFRQFCLEMSFRGKPVWNMELEDYIVLRPKRSKKFPEIVKLYLKYKMELAKSESEEEHYMRLYYKIKVPPKRDKLVEYLEPDEVKALIDACAKINFELKVLVEALYETGARVGEILLLRGRDVKPDPDGVVLRLWKSKSKSREVKMVMFAPDLLRLAEGKGQDEYIFSYNYNTYLKWLRKAWKMAGLRDVHRKFHILRHTRATQLYGKITQQAMMLLFGWESEKMIRRYAHVSPQRAFEEYMQAIGAKPKKKEEEIIKCPRCGHPNMRGAEYCVRCGFPLTPEKREEITMQTAELQAALREIKRLAAELKALKQALQV